MNINSRVNRTKGTYTILFRNVAENKLLEVRASVDPSHTVVVEEKFFPENNIPYFNIVEYDEMGEYVFTHY